MHLYEPIFPARFPHIHAGLMWRILLIVALLLALPFLAGCHHSNSAAAASGATITLSSAGLQGGNFPRQFTCDGEDNSPPLAWTAPPGGTKSFALIVSDPDAPGSTFTHWILYNIPAARSDLQTAVPNQEQLADGSRQGRNDFGKLGYGGPCPPRGAPHRYIFALSALDRLLPVQTGASLAQVEAAMKGHVLAIGELTARYGR